MKKVALIHDMSGFGKCSLTAAIPVISVMGIQACPLPTAILSAQTGFEDYRCWNFTEQMGQIAEHWNEMKVDFEGIYSGYLAGSDQVDKVLEFLKQFRKEDTFYLVDPVMGDHGKFYSMFDRSFSEKMKELTLKADVVTPNLTELCMLTNENYEELVLFREERDYLERIKELCRMMLKETERKQTVIVTGILRLYDGKEYVGNLAISEEECVYIEHPYTGLGFSGTGDLFASVICGALMKGKGIKQAMEQAAFFLQEAIEEATRENIPTLHGVLFEKYLYKLL